jgi:hypothetical protein
MGVARANRERGDVQPLLKLSLVPVVHEASPFLIIGAANDRLHMNAANDASEELVERVVSVPSLPWPSLGDSESAVCCAALRSSRAGVGSAVAARHRHAVSRSGLIRERGVLQTWWAWTASDGRVDQQDCGIKVNERFNSAARFVVIGESVVAGEGGGRGDVELRRRIYVQLPVGVRDGRQSDGGTQILML